MKVQVVDQEGSVRGDFEGTATAVAWAHKHLAGEWDSQVAGADVVQQRAERGPVQV